jgi:hypothetical protein
VQQSRGHLGVAARPADPVSTLTPVMATPLQPVVPPRQRRPAGKTLVLLAVVTGMAAIALGAWALFGSDKGSPAPATTVPLGLEKAVSILAGESVTRIPLSGSVGRIVLIVGQEDDAVLMLNALGPAPAGKTYQAWVTTPRSTGPVSSALFDGTDRFVPLAQPVVEGATVGVTLEQEGGAPAPSREPRLSALRPLG